MRLLIGKPWCVPCDPPHSFDCWELVRHVRFFYGKETPCVVDLAARRPKDRKHIETPPEGWHKVPEGTLLSVVRMGQAHVGVLTEQGVIHCSRRLGVALQPLSFIKQTESDLSFWEYSDA